MLKLKIQKANEMGLSLEEYNAQKVVLKRQRQRKQVKTGLTIEGRQRISESAKKRWRDPEFRLNYTLHSKGFRNHSESTRLRISEAIKLKWQDDEYRNKLSLKQKSTSSDDRKKKISETLKAKWEDPEFRDRMRVNISSKSQEWRAAVSMKIKEKWKNPEYRSAVINGLKRSISNSTSNLLSRSMDDDTKIARLEERKRKKIEKDKRELSKQSIISNVKDVVKRKALGERNIKDLLGSELWFEEKVNCF